MKKILTKGKIEKIINRTSKKFTINEIKINEYNFIDLQKFLANQIFLDNKKIDILLKFNSKNEYPIGYIMKDFKNNIIGFMGTIFYEKFINKKKFIHCNIHSWVVNKQYRLNSFFLITPLLKDNISLTAFTPIKSLQGLLEKFGLKKKSLNYKIIVNTNLINFFNKKFLLVTDKGIILKYLNNKDINKFQEYADSIFYKFIILNTDNNKYIFIIASKIKKKFINFFNFIYISDREKFKENWDNIKSSISIKFNTIFFLEYYFSNNDSFFPTNILFCKIIKKTIFSRTAVNLDKYDISNSDLIIS
jgi:hypothetical protein